MERFFYLDDADRDLIGNRRGEHNRLGFAVQLGTVRFLGTFLADPLDVPWCVVDYLAAQLDVADPSVVKRYSERVATSNSHAREIRQVCGYRDLSGALEDELSTFVYSRAWMHGEGPTTLFEQATGWLRREGALLPGVTTLVRVVQSARESAQANMHGSVAAAAERADPHLGRRLRGLLAVDSGLRASRLEALRSGPTRLSGQELDKALKRRARAAAGP